MSSTPRPRCWSARARNLRRSRHDWRCSRARPRRPSTRAAATAEAGSRLLGHLHHVIDGLLDELVGEIRAAALGGHHSALALEALERMVVEGRLALGDAWPPGRLVAGLGRTGDARAVAGAAHLLEDLGAILRRRGDRGGTGSPRVPLDGDGRVVVTGDRHLARRRETRGDVPAVVALLEYLLVLGLARHHAGKGEDTDGYSGQEPDDQAEYVDEVGVLFAHDARFPGRTGPIRRRSIAAPLPAR